MRSKKLLAALLGVNLLILLLVVAIVPGQLGWSSIAVFGQQEGVELVGPDSGEWIIALLDPKNTDVASDACAILTALVDEGSSANQAGQFNTGAEGPTVALALLERYGLIEWTGTEWAPFEFAAGEAAKFCL